MSIPIIDTIKPLGDFPAVESENVQCGNLRLNEVLESTSTEIRKKADTSYVDAKIAAIPAVDVSSKADIVYVDQQLNTKVSVNQLNSKADLSTVNDLQSVVNEKADRSSVESLSEKVTETSDKANNIQAQVDALVIEASGDSNPEVIQARIGTNGTAYETLKDRIDSENTSSKNELKITNANVSQVLNSVSNGNKVKNIFKVDVNPDGSFPLLLYPGIAHLCNIPKILNGIAVNLKISVPTSKNTVTVSLKILDKDSYDILFETSKLFAVTKTSNNTAFVKDDILFNPVFNLPETAYVCICVDLDCKLYVLGDPAESYFSDLLVFGNYVPLYVDENGELKKSNKSAGKYAVWFGVISFDVTSKTVEGVDSEINNIKNTFYQEKNDRKRLYVWSENAAFNKTAYPFSGYRAYGYLINTPKSYGGAWINIILTPKDTFSKNFSDDVEIKITLRDKDTKEILVEHSKKFRVEFDTELGYGTIRNASLIIENAVSGLPSQVYLCIEPQFGYMLNVTTDNGATKYTTLPVLNTQYMNIYTNGAGFWTASNSIYSYTCDCGVFERRYNERFYNLHDAFLRWSNGEKFPIAFIGDSTTDGVGTTGYQPNVIGTNHISDKLYTKILQDMLAVETKNDALRIYNAGFSGKTTMWAYQNFEAEFDDTPYSDVKMIGINLGINDKPNDSTRYYDYKYNIYRIVDKCLKRGIQPFLLTPQATLEDTTEINRYEYMTVSYAKKAVFEVADELNLEVIDLNSLTARFIENSSASLKSIINDHCHFGDYGHLFEAGALFKTFVPRVIEVNSERRIGFDTQGVKTDLESSSHDTNAIIFLDSPTNGFKSKASKPVNNENISVMDAWVFLEKPMSITAYSGSATSATCYIDTTAYRLDSSVKNLTNLDAGLHHISVMSGSSAIDFYGLKLV